MGFRCFICQGSEFQPSIPPYQRCRQCGHETQPVTEVQTFMLNAPLGITDVQSVSWLDRFQDRVLDRFGRGAREGQWVDLGSGSGKLLARNHRKFARHCGVEITASAVEFSRQMLNLNIATELSSVTGDISLVTAWHSLEHFPTVALESLIAQLKIRLAPKTRVIVSVPNSTSFQYRLFREHYAYFDVTNHPQQFSADSLHRLFSTHGFRSVRLVVSWPYNIFGYAQGFLNLVLPGHNYLYYRLKRGAPLQSRLLEIANFTLLLLALPLGAGLSLFDAVRPKRQAVLTWCFERIADSPTSNSAVESAGTRRMAAVPDLRAN